MGLKQERENPTAGAESEELCRQLIPSKHKPSTTLQYQNAVQPNRKKANPTFEATDCLGSELQGSDSSELQVDLWVVSAMLRSQGCRPLLRGIFSLAVALRTADLDRPKMLASIKGVVDTIDDLSKEICNSTSIKKANRSRTLEELCVVFVRTYPILLRSVRAVRAAPDEKDRGQPSIGVTEVVRSFQIFLGLLHQSSLDELVRQEKQAASGKKTSRFKSKETHDNMVGSNYQKDSRCLVQVLVNMITTLAVVHPSNCEVLEGLVCSLLDHVGSSLALLVFGDPKMSPKDQGGICPPEGLLHVSHLNCKDAILIAKLEGPWLVQILREVTAFHYENAQTMTTDSLIQFLPRFWGQVKGANLREGLRQTLQHTLLRGVFGDDDETFNDALRRVEGNGEGDESVESARLKDALQDPADSFIEQLWEILGWGILSGGKSALSF
ncbi:uncharacterized protein A1O9_08109 [Exophiala aquamarina CBS 119918]|uniref:Uncharacterized protein n=1 Tax=Exophiala aquamarina CBS 119918 TaxID=1182545 RepID=A0A072P5K2_9EURO|nr:uncharacterized protein A1O9_08109 [Exophiala aquamarina CBS 119918]KEF55359.1 hypothetical protein A1O9_08109 [Exophiala aquamarina CBS 119918]